MLDPRTTFPTTGRNPLSSKAGWPSTTEDPQADYSRTGYGQQRGLGSLLPAEKPEPAPETGLSAALAVLARFGREARNAFPDLLTEVFLVERTDAAGTHAPQWGVRATGQPLGSARPSTQASTPAQAIQQLKGLVGTLRRQGHARRDAAALARRGPAVCSECRRTLGTGAGCPDCAAYLTQQAA